MAEITINIPDELNEEINMFKLDVSRAIIETIRSEIIKFAALQTLATKSKLNEEKSLELGKILKKGRFNKLKEKGFI
ncbi:hypothetical protein HYW75_01510 [Candidatus Pacearchaeota archaeon]|nr:hypothetical protein [Candidatus Pacearchaeota archaeon]